MSDPVERNTHFHLSQMSEATLDPPAPDELAQSRRKRDPTKKISKNKKQYFKPEFGGGILLVAVYLVFHSEQKLTS